MTGVIGAAELEAGVPPRIFGREMMKEIHEFQRLEPGVSGASNHVSSVAALSLAISAKRIADALTLPPQINISSDLDLSSERIARLMTGGIIRIPATTSLPDGPIYWSADEIGRLKRQFENLCLNGETLRGIADEAVAILRDRKG